MRTVQKFTYPTFMSICSLLAACADILQNQAFFFAVITILMLLGLLSGLASWRPVASRLPEQWMSESQLEPFGIDPSIKSALRPFCYSCFILAGIIYVLAAMSARASDEGGALVATFPELQQVQLALGRIQQDVVELKQQTTAIKQDTTQLVETAVKWLSLDVNLNSTTLYTDSGEARYQPDSFYVNLANQTGQTFEDVELVVTDGTKALISKSIKILPQDGYDPNYYDDGKAYPMITICLTAKRRGRDEWVREGRVYETKQAHLAKEPSFELVSSTDQQVLMQKPNCLL